MGKSSVKNMLQEILTELRQPTLLPFYMTSLLYLWVYSPHIERPQELLSVAILKALPIWTLAFKVYLSSSGGNNSGKPNAPGADVALTLFLGGLLMSSVGDVCLVYTKFFPVGVLAFAFAQFCYLLSMRQLFKRGSFAWIVLPLGFTNLLLMVTSIHDYVLLTEVVVYLALIHTMLFMAIASFESNPSAPTVCIMAGAAIFTVSDFTIAVNSWVWKFGCAEGVILFTYYIAQLLLTVGMTKAKIPWRL
ncbi:unnamed protein product [Lymnaea stagnalis]|uniref:lysoplasmalogenase n=1 Tax=Lymnaea stagnalis TaxID=6523 RepID=A0AAV2H2B5_LYMST